RRSVCAPTAMAFLFYRRPVLERRSIMWFSSWLQKRKRSNPGPHLPTSRSRPGKRPTFRPRLEALEDRWLPSTLTVLSTADSGPGSLRAEIAVDSSGDTIVFDPSLAGQTINLTSGELVIDKSLDIEGTAGGSEVISGGASRVFDVTSTTAPVTLANLIVAFGHAKNGSGILNAGSVTLNYCEVVDNEAFDKGLNSKGGGVDNLGTMHINNSDIAGNLANDGGGIANHGAMTITNSSLEENGGRNGGAIDNRGTLSVSACTFDPNTPTLRTHIHTLPLLTAPCN